MNIFPLEYDKILPILKKVPMHPERQEKKLPEAVKMLADEYESSVITYPLAEHVPDLTTKTDIIAVRKYLVKHYPDFQFSTCRTDVELLKACSRSVPEL